MVNGFDLVVMGNLKNEKTRRNGRAVLCAEWEAARSLSFTSDVQGRDRIPPHQLRGFAAYKSRVSRLAAT